MVTTSTSVPRQAAGRPHPNRGGSWRAFLKPGWFLAAAAILIFSYFAFTFLAPWQLGKNHDISERNERIEKAFDTDPVPAGEIFGPNGQIRPEDEWRRVILSGQYLSDAETVLRMRPVQGNPAVQVLTPLKTDSGEVILVNRGWIPAEGAAVPEITPAPSGPVSVEAVARRNESTPDRAPLTEDGITQVYGIDTDYIGRAVRLEMSEDFAQISTPDQPGALTPMPIPKLDRGSHLSYGLQWIAFGVMAPAGLAYFIWAELKERRKVGDEEAELEDAQQDSVSDAAADGRRHFKDLLWDDDLSAPPPGETHRELSRSVADRYGSARRDDYAKFARRSQERF